MPVSLVKGGNVNLSKEAPGVTTYVLGLGWDARTTTGADFDLDACAIVVGADGKVLSDSHFVFYGGNKENVEGKLLPATPEQSVVHSGDNRTGEGGGDDERIVVDTTKLPPNAERVVFPVSIYDAVNRGQSFGQVRNAYIRVLTPGGADTEIARYDLSEDAAGDTAMIFGELYRHNGEWKFRAVGQGYASGLYGIADDFGVNV